MDQAVTPNSEKFIRAITKRFPDTSKKDAENVWSALELILKPLPPGSHIDDWNFVETLKDENPDATLTQFEYADGTFFLHFQFDLRKKVKVRYRLGGAGLSLLRNVLLEQAKLVAKTRPARAPAKGKGDEQKMKKRLALLEPFRERLAELEPENALVSMLFILGNPKRPHASNAISMIRFVEVVEAFGVEELLTMEAIEEAMTAAQDTGLLSSNTSFERTETVHLCIPGMDLARRLLSL